MCCGVLNFASRIHRVFRTIRHHKVKTEAQTKHKGHCYEMSSVDVRVLCIGVLSLPGLKQILQPRKFGNGKRNPKIQNASRKSYPIYSLIY
jgi:hypothetical protein